MTNTKPMVLVTKETVIKSIIIEVPVGVEDVEEYCHEYAAEQAQNDEWEFEESNLETIQIHEYEE